MRFWVVVTLASYHRKRRQSTFSFPEETFPKEIKLLTQAKKGGELWKEKFSLGNHIYISKILIQERYEQDYRASATKMEESSQKQPAPMTDEQLALKRQKANEAWRRSYHKHREERAAKKLAYIHRRNEKLRREAQEDPEAALRLEQARLRRKAYDKARGARRGTKWREWMAKRAAERREANRKARIKAEARKQQDEALWRELGWIVAKMNIKARLNQDAIYNLLGGLATRKQIRQWCQRGKKSRTLKKPK